MAYKTILVIGGSGFIGRHIVGLLDAANYEVFVPTRNPENARHLTVYAQTELIDADVHDEAALNAIVRRVDAVINLVGILHDRRGQPYGPGFARNHVELPARIVDACRAAGVKRLLHMSALGADSNGASMYLRSKGDGEARVHASGLDWTIFRPSVVFGAEDKFLNLFARMQRHAPFVPLACAGARFQPVFVGDVAQAFVAALQTPATVGRCYELGGPQVLTLEQIVRFAGRAVGHPRPVYPLSPAMGRLQAFMLEHLPGGPLMTCDNLDSMTVDNVLHGPLAPELRLNLRGIDIMLDHLAGRAPAAHRQAQRRSPHR